MLFEIIENILNFAFIIAYMTIFDESEGTSRYTLHLNFEPFWSWSFLQNFGSLSPITRGICALSSAIVSAGKLHAGECVRGPTACCRSFSSRSAAHSTAGCRSFSSRFPLIFQVVAVFFQQAAGHFQPVAGHFQSVAGHFQMLPIIFSRLPAESVALDSLWTSWLNTTD